MLLSLTLSLLLLGCGRSSETPGPSQAPVPSEAPVPKEPPVPSAPPPVAPEVDGRSAVEAYLDSERARSELLPELEARVAETMFPRFVGVAGRRIDRLAPGNAPNHLFLADGRHIGTIGQGLIAQRFARAAFVHFGLGIAPLSHREIVAIADSLAPPAEAELALAPGAP